MITLKFTFKHAPSLIKGVERKPRLCFHLSSDVGHQIVIVDPAVEKNQVVFDIAVPETGGPFIERDAALHVWQFVGVDNDSGEKSCNEAGYALFPLEAILNNRTPVQVSQDLVVMNARNLHKGIDARKGKLMLFVEKSSFPDGRSPFLPTSKYNVVQENQKFLVATLSNYLKSTSTIFGKKPSTYKSVKYLHLPLWSFGSFSVPGCAFAIPRAEPSPEDWWYNASRMALRRHYQYMTLEQAEERFLSDISEEEVMTVASKMHTGVVNHVSTYLSDGVYITKGSGIASARPSTLTFDTFSQPEGAFGEDIFRGVGAKPILKRRQEPELLISGGHSDRSKQFVNFEAFTLGRMRIAAYRAEGYDDSGDCEDDAAEICLQAMELKGLETTDPVLAKMRDVRQNYLVLQVLMGVRGAQLSDSEKRGNSDAAHAQLGGHMAAMYISVEDFLRMHAKYNQAKPLYEGLTAAPGQRSRPLILEGTGLVDPIGSPEYAKTIASMRYLLKGSGTAFQRIKFIQPQSRDKLNSFYRVVQSFASPDLADKYSSIELVALKKNRGHISTGADYLEFINGDETIALYSMPNMNEDEIRVTKQILKHRFPAVGYKTPTEKVGEVKSHNEHLETVRKFMATQHRHAGDYDVVDFYPRYTQVNASLASDWKHLITSKSRIVDFQYFEENLGENVGGYLARFYVEHE